MSHPSVLEVGYAKLRAIGLIGGRLIALRILKLPILKIEKLWFPLIKYILRTQFKKKQELKVAIDRTQWRDKNVFMISLIWDKRALPLYWQILPKRGCSNLREQQSLISPILDLLKNHKFVLLGDA
ncbi:hypothetical protein [Phormidium nigroviride]